ncbi:A/G-specific adenine glycosylase [Porphyromonadaceae bacterium W3.11]|nr:A/G-specific adenine glycosylase [Porphyromonadaceae bacterium W3.11]
MAKKNIKSKTQLPAVSIPEVRLSLFRTALTNWFKLYGRALPWRETKDPYRIWLSEVILQQTQVVQGWDYYLRFIERYPTVSDLAAAPEDEVMLMWQGLGYYSRALNLHHAAKQIVESHGGIFPTESKDVANLKGVGAYTTAAIMSIAYDQPFAVVDGNVYRVLSRVGAYEVPIDETYGQKFYRELADLYLDKEDPSLYNQAIMDLGAMICKPRTPSCDECPIAKYCESCNNLELTSLLPIKSKSTKVTPLFMDYFLLIDGDYFYVEERDKKGIWKGLYQLPLVESLERNMTPSEVEERLDNKARVLEHVDLSPHRLTHRLISICVHVSELLSTELEGKYQKHLIREHDKLAFPKPLRQFLDNYFPK